MGRYAPPGNPADAFQHGLGQGLELARFGQSQQLAQAHLALSQESERRRASQEDDRLGLAHDAANLRNRVDQRKEADETADRSANLGEFDRLDQQPDPDAVGPYPEGQYPQIGGRLHLARDAFAAASPATQQRLLAPTLQGERDARRQQVVEDIKTRARDTRFRNDLSTIEAADIDEQLRDQLRRGAMLKHYTGRDPANEESPLALSEWQTLPIRQGMDPKLGTLTDQWVTTNGKFPPAWMLNPALKAMAGAGKGAQVDLSARRNPAVATALQGVKQATADAYATEMEHRAALQAFNGAQRAATVSGDTDAIARLPGLQKALQDASTKLDAAHNKLHMAHDQAIKVYQNAGVRGPAQPEKGAAASPMSIDEAAAKATQILGPTATREARAALAKHLFSGAAAAPSQPASAPASNPYDDTREEPDDTEPDLDADDEENF